MAALLGPGNPSRCGIGSGPIEIEDKCVCRDMGDNRYSNCAADEAQDCKSYAGKEDNDHGGDRVLNMHEGKSGTGQDNRADGG